MNQGLSVLWASDGSEECIASAGIIRALLAATASRIHILTIAPHAGSQFLLQNALHLSSQPDDQALKEAGQAVEMAVQALGIVSAQVEKSIRWGIASREIAKTARELDVDIIVLGLKPHGLLRRLLLGDTGLQVLQATSSTVLLTRPYSDPELRSVILLCLDPVHFLGAASYVEGLQLPATTRIYLTGFIEPPRLSPGVIPSYTDLEREQAEGSREARRHALGNLFAGAARRLMEQGRAVESLVVEERLEAGLKKVGDDLQPGVVIMGAGPFGAAFSSAAEAANVALLASCSVIVVR